MNTGRTPHAFWILGVMISITLAPLGLAFVFQQHHGFIASRPQGQLIQPPLLLPVLLQGHFRQHAPMATQAPWHLIAYATSQTNPYALQHLCKQLHTALSTHRDRFHCTVLLAPDVPSIPYLAYPATTSYYRLPALATSLLPVGARWSLIDPQGYLMMVYSEETPAPALFKDLKRLLRINKGHT